LAEKGRRCVDFGEPAGTAKPGSDAEIRAIARWLKGLPKPVGVFACYDGRALQVLEACQLLGLHVPDQVAVLGVDNDELVCELANPPLSSVQPNARRSGYEAAALLAFLGMAETAEIAVQQAQPAILEAEAGLLAGQLDRAYSAFQQPFLVHLLILLRLELVAPPLVRLVTAAELQEPQEALDRVYPAVGLQTVVLQAVAVS
jgi:hypothetical protein